MTTWFKHNFRVHNIKTDLQETGWQTWIGPIWLKTGTCGRILQTWWTFGFNKMWIFCWLAKELSASPEALYCMQLSSQSVSWLPIIRYLVSCPCIYRSSLVLVHTQTQNTHLVFLHNTKYSFQSLYYSSGTVTAWNCRMVSKCNRVADRNLTQLNTFGKCIWKKTYWSHTCDWTCHITHSNTRTFLSSTNWQQCYNKMWSAIQTQTGLLQKYGNIHLNEISLLTDPVYLCT
jgi:hypothetical protein